MKIHLFSAVLFYAEHHFSRVFDCRLKIEHKLLLIMESSGSPMYNIPYVSYLKEAFIVLSQSIDLHFPLVKFYLVF